MIHSFDSREVTVGSDFVDVCAATFKVKKHLLVTYENLKISHEAKAR